MTFNRSTNFVVLPVADRLSRERERKKGVKICVRRRMCYPDIPSLTYHIVHR